jgi:hypothetical protein
VTATIKTAVRQDKKAATTYDKDGQQAYYLHRAGSQETWFTDGAKAVEHWEEAGGELYVGRSTNKMNKIR